MASIVKEIRRKNRDFHFELLSTQIATMSYCSGQFELSMIASIPEDQPFTLYEIDLVPLYNVEMSKFLIFELPELVAIGQGSNVELSTRTFNEECNVFHTHYSCPQGVSPVRSNTRSCVNSLLLATDLNRTLEVCTHRYDTLKSHELKLIRGTSSVKYVLPQAVSCKLKCPLGNGRETFKTFSLHGSGIYPIPKDCSLNVGDLETFHSSMHMLYYNETFISYDITEAKRMMEIARVISDKGSRIRVLQDSHAAVAPEAPPVDRPDNEAPPWVVILISISLSFLCSTLAMLPLYRKVFFPARHDSALKATLSAERSENC